MTLNIRALLALAILSPITAPATAFAAEAPIYTGTFSSVAVSGYDPVAYFKAGKPIKGDKQFTYKWMGAEWRFSSAENRDAFAKSPTSYAPQYGGYCAYAVAMNSTASSDPKAWKIVDGKLYLNYDADIGKKWAAKQNEYIKSANANWPRVLGN